MRKILLSSFVTFGLYANAQISVSATAGTPTATYTTLKDTFDAINAGTHQGNINLSITANTTETASAVLNAVTTYSAIVIKPTVAATISGAVASNPLVKILGNNVTIDGSITAGGTTKDLTFSNTSTTGPSVVFMGSAASATPLTNVTLKNAIFINGSANSTNIIIANGTTTAGYFNNITIQNNELRTGFNGLFVLANTAAGNGNNLVITGNTINNTIVQNGIYVAGVGGTSTISNNTVGITNPTVGSSTTPAGAIGINVAAATNNASVFGNTISVKSTAASGVNYTTGIALSPGATNVSTKIYNNTITEVSGFLTYINSSGVYLTGVTPNVSIYNNKVSGIKNTNTGGTPIQGFLLGSTSTAANVLVYNNSISDVQGTGASQVAGIYAFAGAGYKIYNNSVSLNTSNTETGISAGLYVYGTNITAANGWDIRNNILSNSKTGGSRYAIYSTAANTVFSNIDYNNYSSSGTALGYTGSADRVTLANIQTGFGGNTNSLALTPIFNGTTDLHLSTSSNAGLDNKGVTLAEVTTDLDGTTRSATPDMGAYEFTYVAPVTAPNCTTITSPVNNATGVTPNPTSIVWANANGATGYKVYLGTTSGGTDIVNGTVTTGLSYSTTLDTNTAYYVKIVPYNLVGDATGCTEVKFTTGNVTYCAAGATTSDEKITNVTFSNINNSSTNTTNYFDFTGVTANVNKEQSYPITVTTSPSYSTDAVYVWIDFNNDGTFDDATEKTTLTYNYSGASATPSTSTGSIAIPTTALVKATRMRIRLNYTTSGSNTTACGNSTYGEVEDYTVNISGPGMAVSDVSKANISVYPNPFTDVLKISDVKGVKSISVNDMAGRQVKSLAPSAEINLSSLKAGLYIVNLQMEDGSIKTFKAIKK